MSYWQNMLDYINREIQTFEKKLKLSEQKVKAMVESGKFDIVDLKIEKDSVEMYRGFIKKSKSDIAEITARIAKENEPKKIGRPSIGKARPVKITLPEEDWKQIEQAIQSGEYNSYAEYFRNLHEEKERV